jgi:hypothetical protein
MTSKDTLNTIAQNSAKATNHSFACGSKESNNDFKASPNKEH